MDIFPVTDGHTLIIPKAHCDDIFGADSSDLRAVMDRSREVAHAIGRVLAPDGLGVFQLNGAAAGQTVFHYHMHLIPRNHGAGDADPQPHARRPDADGRDREAARRRARFRLGPARQHLDGDPVQHRGARERVERELVGEDVAVRARALRGDREPRAGLVVAPAVRQAHDAGRDPVGDLDRRLDAADARRDARERARARGRARRRRRGGAGACSARGPSRASAGCASTSCSSARGGARRAGGPARAGRATRRGGRGRRPAALARARSSRSACAAAPGCAARAGRGRCRAACAASRSSVSPSGFAPKWSPYGPERSARSTRRSGPRALVERGEDLVGVATFDRRARRAHRGLHLEPDHERVERVDVGLRALAEQHAEQAQQHLPLLGRARAAARTPAANSAPSCAPRAAGTRRRSATARAARARAGSRRRGASSRSGRCRR